MAPDHVLGPGVIRGPEDGAESTVSEAEWDRLRRELCKQFDEDIVQQVILELLEKSVTGVTVINPLHWCRMRAKSRRANENRSAAREREMKEGLASLKIPYDNRTGADLKAARDRRHYPKKKKRKEAA